MFVLSLKSKVLKKAAALILSLLIFSVGGIVLVSKTEILPASSQSAPDFKGGTEEERQTFFSRFGLEASSEAEKVKEIIIPEEFDETYTSYNELQKKQGFDLNDYKGMRVKMWSYDILNYPQKEGSGLVKGNLLVCEDKIIGGDVSSVEIDGFMCGFDEVIKSNR